MSSPTLGIFGGSFDPIHLGHLHSIWEVTQQLPLDVIHFIPCLQSPLKPPPFASPEARLTMLEYATANEPRWVVNECEIERQKISYTIDTLESLHKQFPEHQLCLIIGTDVVGSFLRWKRWQSILSFAHLIVMTRADYKLQETPWTMELERRTLKTPQELRTQKNGGVYWQPITPLTISATHIRELCAQNKTPPFLIPTDVWNYIEEYQLYRTEK